MCCVNIESNDTHILVMTESTIKGISSLEHNKDSRIDPVTEVDYILKSLGSVGKYQKTQLVFILLCIMENSFHLGSSVYIGKWR